MKKLQTTLDKITTLISAILCAAMMVILFANVVLRLIPGIGGFKWYMESSQYLNVWSMLIACIGINAMGTNLRVEVVDPSSVRLRWAKRSLSSSVMCSSSCSTSWSPTAATSCAPAQSRPFPPCRSSPWSGVHHLPHCRCAVHPVRRSQSGG